MKKIYTLIAATLVTVSVSASDFRHPAIQEVPALNALEKIYHTAADVQTLDGKYVLEPQQLIGARKVDSNATIDGMWEFTIGDYYMDSSTRRALRLNFIAAYDGSTLIFQEETGNYFPLVAGYSENSGLIWFTNELLLEDGPLKIYQQTFIYNGGTQNQQITAHYNASEGTITWDKENSGIGISVSYTQGGQEQTDVLDMFDLLGAVRPHNWTTLQGGQFTENIIYPFFFGAATSTPSSVIVQRNEDVPGVYRIKDPFRATFNKLNNPGKSADLIFDARDPENVLIIEQAVGIQANLGTQLSPKPTGYLLYFSDSWYYQETQIYWNEEGVVNLTMTSDEEGNMTLNIPGSSMVLYGAQIDQGFKCPYASKLTFKDIESGVADVITDNENAPVEYFNIQGIRVVDPQPGQILIKRQGNKAEKIIIK